MSIPTRYARRTGEGRRSIGVMDIWTLVRFLHLLAVAAWLGGMLFLGLIVVPSVRAHGGLQASRALITTVGRRYGVMGGIAWVFLLGTGLAMFHHRTGGFSTLGDGEYGRKVLKKLVLLILMGVAIVFHSLVQSPRLRRAEADGDEATRARWRRVGAVIDAGVLLATLLALWLGVSLVW